VCVCVCVSSCSQAKIKDELQADSVVVSDVYGDGRHVSIDVISSAFEGGWYCRAAGQGPSSLQCFTFGDGETLSMHSTAGSCPGGGLA